MIRGICNVCNTRHFLPELRFKCKECETVLCKQLVVTGKKWNRKGKLLHIKWKPGEPRVLTVCGEVERIEDYPTLPPNSVFKGGSEVPENG